MESCPRELKLEKLKKLKDSMKKVALKKMNIKQSEGATMKQMTDGKGVSSVNPSYPGFKNPFKK